MQRLFSTFPSGWPGAGLLLLRLCLGITLIHIGFVTFPSSAADAIAIVENVIAIAAGLLVLAGFWTPLAGGLAALAETGQALLGSSPAREPVWIYVFLAVLSVSVAMLGPGVWSIDARLFGRKRFDLGRARSGRL